MHENDVSVYHTCFWNKLTPVYIQQKFWNANTQPVCVRQNKQNK